LAEGDKIRLATNIPGLKDKIYANISDGKDSVYWYLQFNIPLDKNTVSDKTMKITDTTGYIMRTDISYIEGKHIIVISPLDSYEENVYYLLYISRRVKSSSGKKMRTKIHILFKLMNNQISDYKILRGDVDVPQPKPRPKDYDQLRSRVYSLDETPYAEAGRGKLPPAKLSVNVVIGALGLLIVAGYFFYESTYLIAAGFAVCALGAAHIVAQVRKKSVRSALAYNRGVQCFNGEKYARAKIYFRKAALIDPGNEMAEYALNKVEYYVD